MSVDDCTWVTDPSLGIEISLVEWTSSFCIGSHSPVWIKTRKYLFVKFQSSILLVDVYWVLKIAKLNVWKQIPLIYISAQKQAYTFYVQLWKFLTRPVPLSLFIFVKTHYCLHFSVFWRRPFGSVLCHLGPPNIFRHLLGSTEPLLMF
jgi:hypothetical protein